ncbi:MAG TPA: toll/interleukin-1 receptor domain-containing protein [Thermoanaerobaculia bacterium]|nr:toll/interleukin-1 receptor domain-containing protein [Thermoanaerobaculia bacterium]
MILGSLLRYDVFIAYSSEDREFVQQLVTFLESDGINPFWAGGSIQLGEPWPTKIQRVLSEEIPGIVVLSPDAMGSGMVQQEIDVLVQRANRLIIPILLRDCEPPAFLVIRHGSDCRDRANWESEFQKIASAIRNNSKKERPPNERNGRGYMSVSLRRLLAACLFASVGSVFLASLLFSGCRTYEFKRLQRLQREVQSIDRALLDIHPHVNPESGTEVYSDRWGVVRGIDLWNEDQLLLRRLFDGRLVAQDEFTYSESDKFPIGKVRFYLDEDQNVFLVDEFARDGLLIRKRACPDGPERPCDVYIDDMRSPMPPPSLFLYR